MEKIPSTVSTIEDRLETLVDVEDFNSRVIDGYNEGSGPLALKADVYTARSIIPAGTGAYRDFSYIAP